MTCGLPYEELACYAAGESEPARADEIREHVAQCPRCRQRLDALGGVDAGLAAVTPDRPSAQTILGARRALAGELRAAKAPEIMTLDEVAEFLRVDPDELGEIAEELPAFELAGRVRVRRARLVEWISQRERAYSKQAAESWAAQVTSDTFNDAMGAL